MKKRTLSDKRLEPPVLEMAVGQTFKIDWVTCNVSHKVWSCVGFELHLLFCLISYEKYTDVAILTRQNIIERKTITILQQSTIAHDRWDGIGWLIGCMDMLVIQFAGTAFVALIYISVSQPLANKTMIKHQWNANSCFAFCYLFM